jgi:hypothetical protein
VQATVSVNSSAQVTFLITDPEKNMLSFGPLSPGTGSSIQHTFPAPGMTTCPAGSTACDIVIVSSSATALKPDDPAYNQYTITFNLLSNYVIASCKNTQGSTADSFLVQVVAGSPLISGVCLESYTGMVSPVSCQTPTLLAADSSFFPSVPEATTPPVLGCISQRPAVDVAMVLDKSGSMASTTTSGGSTRMNALHTAVRSFVTVWDNLPPVPGDQIGVVLFDSTSPSTQPPISGFPLALADMTSTTTQTNVPNSVDGVGPGGFTSIGAGLNEANKLFAADGHRKVILLMSDGQQNAEPLVNGAGKIYCDNAAVCSAQGLTGCTSGSPCALSNHPQIYTVTVGPSGFVDPAIASAIATGFYLNTETNYPLLSPFFLELLQNFLKFHSYDTVRLVSKKAPYSASVPISTTSRDVEFSLMWPSNFGLLRFTVTPPGGGQPIVKESDSGFISIVQTLPVPSPFDLRGNWRVLIEAISPAGTPATTAATGAAVPFDLHIMTDDGALKSDLSIVPADYKSGGKIKLRAKLTQFGLPIVGMGSKPGDRIEAELVRPGESVGDLLSDSDASATPQPCPATGPCDKQSPAEAKLANMLKENPSALVHTSEIVQLFDDGNKSEHGDDVAGDGIYSALYPADLPGHYNFLIAAERVDASGPRFSRQQLRTAYVRPFPDGGNTDIQATVISRGVLQIVMTPRGVSGDGLGPGWANYFWFTAPGVTPFKANDNLDGTYTATLNFTGKPPKVSVHFENVLAVIGDSVTDENQLPQPLDSNNVLVSNIPVLSRWAAFLDLGGAFPHGTFSNFFDPGFSLNAGLEYMVTSHFSAEGVFAYHHFPAKSGAGLNVYQFSGNAKVYLVPPQKFRPFLNGGIGAYKFSPGSGNFGGNFGGGVLYELTPRFGLQGSYNFHDVNTTGGATKFSAIQGGVRYVF